MTAQLPPLPADALSRSAGAGFASDAEMHDEHLWIGYEAAFPMLSACSLGDAPGDAAAHPG